MQWVSPFGHRGIIALLPAPPRFSQAYTSFVAYHRQGIRLITYSLDPIISRTSLTSFTYPLTK